ncbi:MAG: hypothetical protein CUN54_10545, partial [Phototrophicales bacterium]
MRWQPERHKHTFAILIGITSLIPILLVGHLITRYGQPVPWADEWDDSQIIAINTAQGDLSFGDLLRQYNDSRTFFSHVITAI